jgi:hypothetical protein
VWEVGIACLFVFVCVDEISLVSLALSEQDEKGKRISSC